MDQHASKSHGANLWTLEVSMSPYFGCGGVSRSRIYTTRKLKKTLAMAPPNPRCTIGTKIETNTFSFTSLTECSKRYGANKKIKILFGDVLEVKVRQR